MSDLSIDKDFAKNLCDENKKSMAYFQEKYADELFFIASKFNSSKAFREIILLSFSESV